MFFKKDFYIYIVAAKSHGAIKKIYI